MTLTVNSSIRQEQHPVIRQLAESIESIWQRSLTLSPYQLPDDLGFVESRLDGERLTIENHCYQTPEFRKLHLELACVGEYVDILHCVMFPRLEYALPLFGCDIVSGRGNISAAIVDLSPTSSVGLPGSYREVLSTLDLPNYSQVRQLPDWGDIFSDYCCFIKPANSQEESQFIAQVSQYLTLHCQQAVTAQLNLDRQQEMFAGQQRYCTQQRQNDKTRRILEKAFGPDWAERYMTTVLFDLPES